MTTAGTTTTTRRLNRPAHIYCPRKPATSLATPADLRCGLSKTLDYLRTWWATYAVAWPSVADMAVGTGQSERQVQRHLRRLRDGGWVVLRPGGRGRAGRAHLGRANELEPTDKTRSYFRLTAPLPRTPGPVRRSTRRRPKGDILSPQDRGKPPETPSPTPQSPAPIRDRGAVSPALNQEHSVSVSRAADSSGALNPGIEPGVAPRVPGAPSGKGWTPESVAAHLAQLAWLPGEQRAAVVEGLVRRQAGPPEMRISAPVWWAEVNAARRVCGPFAAFLMVLGCGQRAKLQDVARSQATAENSADGDAYAAALRAKQRAGFGLLHHEALALRMSKLEVVNTVATSPQKNGDDSNMGPLQELELTTRSSPAPRAHQVAGALPATENNDASPEHVNQRDKHETDIKLGSGASSKSHGGVVNPDIHAARVVLRAADRLPAPVLLDGLEGPAGLAGRQRESAPETVGAVGGPLGNACSSTSALDDACDVTTAHDAELDSGSTETPKNFSRRVLTADGAPRFQRSDGANPRVVRSGNTAQQNVDAGFVSRDVKPEDIVPAQRDEHALCDLLKIAPLQRDQLRPSQAGPPADQEQSPVPDANGLLRGCQEATDGPEAVQDKGAGANWFRRHATAGRIDGHVDRSAPGRGVDAGQLVAQRNGAKRDVQRRPAPTARHNLLDVEDTRRSVRGQRGYTVLLTPRRETGPGPVISAPGVGAASAPEPSLGAISEVIEREPNE